MADKQRLSVQACSALDIRDEACLKNESAVKGKSSKLEETVEQLCERRMVRKCTYTKVLESEGKGQHS
ncbi:hypothetical protein NDU88_002050 [Pleurodeles waltl]|uniref:Uncharacterized protein n=1 Tax=Pleurodeles waltl TaxID=8319 RepID=A0AAV7WND1_PLEWA|nr:hypothetical protein NDU88_002050 [Pleurodeles waltl]